MYPVADPPLNSSTEQPQPLSGHIWIVTGPAGCGKSTIAEYLADELRVPYIEGDEFHPEANIKKMAAGIPLTDSDRWGWLSTLRNEGLSQLQRQSNPTLPRQSSRSAIPDPRSREPEHAVVMTCSALKRTYRDILRGALDVRPSDDASRPSVPPFSRTNSNPPDQPNVHVHFIYLRAPEDVLLARVGSRKGHYMKKSMVRSQFASLEEPKAEEEPDVAVLDVGEGHDPTDVKSAAVEVVRSALTS
ncbi:carbohydrate kinase [Eremomyces bilateralis CBS 781.70]|uniref:gluconokinase n=1 Tax=Eremomyces bilateralis CBS 781.70 TaxID=1392243 RepID=A0A6G1FXA5_9PEZI|nr:carbohydrate kinase [Eremomyces bilateralis CBS 781.70]KAF1810342.1 carbohydrate kinase [Eremomyces bilateralis CBS 781.70]